MIIEKELSYGGKYIEGSIDFGAKKLSFEAGKVAKQANGSVVAGYGDIRVLVTACSSPCKDEERDFFPLTVEYREKSYAAGKIPGGFIKREGKPSDEETLTARIIDRPLRPMFPDGYFDEVQVVATVVSADKEHHPDIAAVFGASLALGLSDIPFTEPIAAARVGYIDGNFVLNPSFIELEKSLMDIVVAASKSSIIMVEGEINELSEDTVLSAIEFAHKNIQPVIELQEEIIRKYGKTKQVFTPPVINEEIYNAVYEYTKTKIREVNSIKEKLEREEKYNLLLSETLEALLPNYEDKESAEKEIKKCLHEIEKKDMREKILTTGIRVDGRKCDEIRHISCEVGYLPRSHGSGLFTRGQTQALVSCTLGTKSDEQVIDALQGETTKSYMLHYNFPPFSVGEVKQLRGPGRREIGHGNLAERALKSIIPSKEEFPYTVRLVSDILESNGSSSMASVCGGTLALMDAGVPIKSPVSGIAMGLITSEEKSVVLTDISGIEDHLGDMDFKVTGTKKGITAFQLDVKIKGIDFSIMKEALEQAKKARIFIIDKILEVIPEPRKELSIYAPRIVSFYINADKIGAVIGPNGKVIKQIIEETGVEIDITNDGKVSIESPNVKALEQAERMIKSIVKEFEVGEIVIGKVKRIEKYGAFLDLSPYKEALLHISEVDKKRVENIEDVLKIGDEILVKIIEKDNTGKIKVSRKKALDEKV